MVAIAESRAAVLRVVRRGPSHASSPNHFARVAAGRATSARALLDRLGAAVLEFDSSGALCEANDAARSLLEQGDPQLAPDLQDTLTLDPDDLALSTDRGSVRVTAHAGDGETFDLDCAVAKTGTTFVVLLRRVIPRDAANHGAPEHSDPLSDAPFAVADYVQLACLGHHSVRVDVARGDLRGSVIVHDGQLWSATAADEHGIAALRELAFAAGAAVRCRSVVAEHIGPRDLPEAPWEQILLDAARRHDEQEHAHAHGHGVPMTLTDTDETEELGLLDEFDDAPDPVSRPSPDERASLSAALDAGTDALLRKDYVAALRAYEQAQSLAPTDRLVLANVARLRAMLRRA